MRVNAFGFVFLFIAVITAQENWPTLLHDNLHSCTSFASPSVGNPSIAWSAKTTLPPVAFEGSFIVCDSGIVISYDEITGNVLWSVPTTEVLSQTPTLYGGLVLFGEGQHMTALNAATGSRVCSAPFGIEFAVKAPCSLTVDASTSTAYAVLVPQSNDLTQPIYFAAYDLNSAQQAPSSFLLWKYPLGHLNSADNETNPNCLAWSAVVSPVGNTVFVAFENTTFAFDSTNGNRLWTFTSKATQISMLSLNGQSLYFGDNVGSITKLDTTSGALLWTQPLSKITWNSHGPCVCAAAGGQQLYVTAQDGVWSLDTDSGATHWTIALETYISPCATILANQDTMLSLYTNVQSNLMPLFFAAINQFTATGASAAPQLQLPSYQASYNTFAPSGIVMGSKGTIFVPMTSPSGSVAIRYSTDAPGVPRDLSASLFTSNSIELMWDPPLNYLASLNYTAQVAKASPTGFETFQTTHVGMAVYNLPAVVGCESNNVFYFRVAASNQYGESAWSDVVSYSVSLGEACPPSNNPPSNSPKDSFCWRDEKCSLTRGCKRVCF